MLILTELSLSLLRTYCIVKHFPGRARQNRKGRSDLKIEDGFLSGSPTVLPGLDFELDLGMDLLKLGWI